MLLEAPVGDDAVDVGARQPSRLAQFGVGGAAQIKLDGLSAGDELFASLLRQSVFVNSHPG
ncbi:MAG: hypothetical protein M3Y55_02340 [Pseudomonadota bacterium]|nr:hypothetical protein [Pseudomonadota bacterium]